MPRHDLSPNTAPVRTSLRSKLIAFTVLPVVLVYSVLFLLGISHINTHLSTNAQALLTEHAHHQASRLALLFYQVPALAGSLGDLILAEPDQDQALLYAHLIDGLRRTPIARAAAIVYDDPPRGAQMQRGEPRGKPFTASPKPMLTSGWQVSGETLRFNRPITRRGQKYGHTWVELRLTDLYMELTRQASPPVVLFVGNEAGLLPPPMTSDEHMQRLARELPHPLQTDRVTTVYDREGNEYWSINAKLPGFPWHITAITPTATALATVREQVGMVALALIISLLAIVLILGLVARQITRPLRMLDDRVRQISHGHFTAAPAIHSNDELGRLANAVTRMARQIADRETLLRNAHQVLEQRVAERTAELRETNSRLLNQVDETRRTQRALEQANRDAQLANRAKSEFLSNMSHELRTPLHGVLGYAQILLRDSALASTQRENLEAIERCGQHLLTLINDILDLTRIEVGQVRLDIQPTDLPKLIEDVELIMAQRARVKGLTLKIELDTKLPRQTMTDAVKLKQILLNLIGNAVKFTEHGSITLKAGLTADEQLAFVVRDTGIGIAPEKTESIFDAFTQVGKGRVTDGTGLGLAINQRLIALLGGQAMTVESNPGDGSQFRFRIPYRPVPKEFLSLQKAAAIGETLKLALPKDAHYQILVIDPSEESRRMLAILLEDAGCRVESHATLREAESILSKRPFDVVLLDVRLSNDTKPTESSAIRSIAHRRPRIVALSANAYSNAAEVARQAGFDAFLAKPFDPQQLFRLLGGLLQSDEERIGTSTGLSWPRALAEETAQRVADAIDQGDVGRLFQLTEELAENPAVPKADIDNIALMARLFDFDGLRRFCAHLVQTD